jgi:hypothetical protein
MISTSTGPQAKQSTLWGTLALPFAAAPTQASEQSATPSFCGCTSILIEPKYISTKCLCHTILPRLLLRFMPTFFPDPAHIFLFLVLSVYVRNYVTEYLERTYGNEVLLKIKFCTLTRRWRVVKISSGHRSKCIIPMHIESTRNSIIKLLQNMIVYIR